MEWIDSVLRDVAELPDRNSPEDWPDAMLVTGAELRQIIVTHAPTEPLDARLLAALRANHQWHIDHDDCGGYPGSELEATNLGAIAAAEAQQAGPVRLTDNDVVDLFQTWNTTYGTSHADLIRAVETSVLERNGLKPQAKGD